MNWYSSLLSPHADRYAGDTVYRLLFAIARSPDSKSVELDFSPILLSIYLSIFFSSATLHVPWMEFNQNQLHTRFENACPKSGS